MSAMYFRWNHCVEELLGCSLDIHWNPPPSSPGTVIYLIELWVWGLKVEIWPTYIYIYIYIHIIYIYIHIIYIHINYIYIYILYIYTNHGQSWISRDGVPSISPMTKDSSTQGHIKGVPKWWLYTDRWLNYGVIVMVMYDGIIWYTMVLWLYFMMVSMVYVQLCILIVVDYIFYYYFPSFAHSFWLYMCEDQTSLVMVKLIPLRHCWLDI